MLFYEELIQKIESQNLTDIKKVEKFTLNMSKKISGYGIALPLIAIGIFQAYSYTLFHKWYLLIFAIIFSFIGFKQFKNIFSYSISIDTEIARIKSGKLDLLFENVESAELKEMKFGKKIITVIDMITKDKKQVIIPLYMNRIERFILLVKSILGDKFQIIK